MSTETLIKGQGDEKDPTKKTEKNQHLKWV